MINHLISKPCTICGKSFTYPRSDTARKTCSYVCAAIFRHKPNPAKNCLYCSKEFIPNYRHRFKQVFCSRLCVQEKRYAHLRLNPNNYRGSKTAKAMLLKENPVCSRCGYSKVIGILQIHHADRIRHHNNRENVSLVCPNCHEEEHWANKDGRYKNSLGKLKSSLEPK